jgi:hypothetical protein
MAVVPFISSSGDVLTVDPEIDPVSGSLIRIRFTLDESDWGRIQESDIFGAKTRRRFPEVLDGFGAVSVTVEGSRLALESPRGWQADDFEIVSAMRKIETSEGAHMVGMLFASAPAWTQALNSLMEMGFIVDGETDDEVSATDRNGTNVMISIYPTNLVATVVFAREMPTGSINSAEVLQLINNLNVSFIIGSVAMMVNEMNAEYLLAKSAVPTIGGVDVPAVLDALVVGLVGLILEVEPVVQRVITGELSVDEATRRLT